MSLPTLRMVQSRSEPVPKSCRTWAAWLGMDGSFLRLTGLESSSKSEDVRPSPSDDFRRRKMPFIKKR